MNISGFELNQNFQFKYCNNAYCSSILPLCFASVSSCCFRNRSHSSWYHFSFGEHVCAVCFEFLNSANSKRIHSSDSVWLHRLGAWRRGWLRKCSQLGRRHIPTAAQFLAAQLLPWWFKCRKCGKWRQLPPHTPIGSSSCPSRSETFTCADIIKKKSDACSWILDERATLVCRKPQDFLASMQTHAWLQAAPSLHILSSYGIDLTGLSPDPLPGANADDTDIESPFKAFDEFGSFSPIDLNSWERTTFPEMTRFPTLYLAIRNLIICLWFRNPKSLLTAEFVSINCFVRGLLRIVLCEYWIPHLVDELTARGFINIGDCQLSQYDQECGKPTSHFTYQKAETIDSKSAHQLRLIGPLNLINVVTARQIYNASLIQHLHTSAWNSCSPLSFQFMCNINNCLDDKTMNSLQELWLTFSTILNGTAKNKISTTTDNLNNIYNNQNHNSQKNAHAITISLPSTCINDLSVGRISVPLHAWSDRVYMYSNHPVSVLAWQTNLAKRSMPQCMLLFNLVDHNLSPRPSHTTVQSKLRRISNKQSVRIEFHVEAVLHLVTQMHANMTTMNDKVNGGQSLEDANDTAMGKLRSVEECWDEVDQEMRKRLSDLTNDEIERGLVEFYLAVIEYDLTEPLTTNDRWTNFGSDKKSLKFSTARLDQLPPYLLTETMIDKNLSNWTLNDGMQRNNSSSAYLLYNSSLNLNSTFNDFNADPGHLDNVADISQSKQLIDGPMSHFLQALTNFHCDPLKCGTVLVNHQFVAIVVTSTKMDAEVVLDASTTTTTTKVANYKSSIFDLHNVNQTNKFSGNIRLDLTNGTEEFVNWIIITTPIHRLRFYFVDDFSTTNLMNLVNSTIDDRSSSLPLFLPSHLHPILVDNNTNEVNTPTLIMNDTQCGSNTAHLITVVLIYATPWWRDYLITLGIESEKYENSSITNGSHKLHEEVNSELFAILPENRDSRGFCHMFRDVRPDVNKPGILQTKIFAKSADYWSSQTDASIVSAVDDYLRRNLTPELLSENAKDSHLLGSHVARLQSRSPQSSKLLEPNSPCLICSCPSSDNPWVRVKPSAWFDLFNFTGVLIPDLMSNMDSAVHSSTQFWDKSSKSIQHTASELINTINPLCSSGMDALSSAVHSGLKLAELALHLLPRQSINDQNSFGLDFHPSTTRKTSGKQALSSNIQVVETEPSIDDEINASTRNRRFSKRRHSVVD